MYLKWLVDELGNRVESAKFEAIVDSTDSVESLKRKLEDNGWSYCDYFAPFDECCEYEIAKYKVRNFAANIVHITVFDDGHSNLQEHRPNMWKVTGIPIDGKYSLENIETGLKLPSISQWKVSRGPCRD